MRVRMSADFRYVISENAKAQVSAQGIGFSRKPRALSGKFPHRGHVWDRCLSQRILSSQLPQPGDHLFRGWSYDS